MNAGDILEVTGQFDAAKWLISGESGLEITNTSPNNLWVYFSMEGDLGRAVQHINPVILRAGEVYQLPIQPTVTDELGLLGWRNNEQVFSGKIIARVLNNFAAYQVGSVKIEGKDLYAKAIREQDDPDKELKGIKFVKDILQLIAEKNSLIEERDKLLRQNEELIQENKQLEINVDSLRSYINDLETKLNNSRNNIRQLEDQLSEQNSGGGVEETPSTGGDTGGTVEETPSTGGDTGGGSEEGTPGIGGDTSGGNVEETPDTGGDTGVAP